MQNREEHTSYWSAKQIIPDRAWQSEWFKGLIYLVMTNLLVLGNKLGKLRVAAKLDP